MLLIYDECGGLHGDEWRVKLTSGREKNMNENRMVKDKKLCAR